VEIIEFEITEATEEVASKGTYAIEGFPNTLLPAFFPLMR